LPWRSRVVYLAELKMPSLRSLFSLFAIPLLSPALADESVFFAELPVVASVSRLPQKLADAPASVTVIDRDMIRASGVRSLNDIFRLVPGFQTFAQSDAKSRVTYHGLTDDNDYSPRVQVLIDGRSLHSPLFRGGVNWGLLPVALEDIERIEVVRGSNSVSYGTNAFLGVVNIITTDPSLVRGFSVSTSVGNQGVRDYTLRGGGSLRDGHYRLTYQEIKDDGLDDSYDWRDDNRLRRLDARLDYQLSDEDSLEVNLGRVEGRFTTGRYACDPLLPKPRPCGPQFFVDLEDPIRDQDESSSWLQARWVRSLGIDADFSLRYSLSEDRGDETFIDNSRDPGYREVNAGGDWGRRHELEAIHHFSPAKNFRLAWGASWRHDALKSDTMLRDRGVVTRQVWRGFANGEWKPLDWITANLGFSNEHDSLAGNHLSPRASLAFHLNQENTLRLGFSRAWRTSSIVAYEANYRNKVVLTKDDQIGNPQLPAELLESWELAYLGDWRGLRMSLDVRTFREKITDRLMLVRPANSATPTPHSERSIQDIAIQGYEAQWKWEPLHTTQLLLNYSRIRINSQFSSDGVAIKTIPGSSLFGVSALPYVDLAERSAPERSLSGALIQRLPGGLELSLMAFKVGEIRWTRNTGVEAYRRLDARLAYPFVWPGVGKGEIAYTVQSMNGAHPEQRGVREDPTKQAEDLLKRRIVDRRHWISLRLDF
jgi:iron complex outermembrane recepter protein